MGAVLCAIAAAITASGSASQDAWLEAVARAILHAAAHPERDIFVGASRRQKMNRVANLRHFGEHDGRARTHEQVGGGTDGRSGRRICTSRPPCEPSKIARATARTLIKEGQTHFCALSWSEHPAPQTYDEAYQRLVWTAHHWQHWLARGTFPDHPWRSYLERSALTLKGEWDDGLPWEFWLAVRESAADEVDGRQAHAERSCEPGELHTGGPEPDYAQQLAVQFVGQRFDTVIT